MQAGLVFLAQCIWVFSFSFLNFVEFKNLIKEIIESSRV
jgi:hypothetical protein